MIDNADELVSAYLDGALSPTERAQVEADPALLARLEEFSAVQDLVRTTPELSDELRERLVADALAASATAANVTSLATRRTRRTRLALAGAAAAAIVVVGGIIALNNDDDDSTSDLAGRSTESSDADAAAVEDDAAFESAPVEEADAAAADGADAALDDAADDSQGEAMEDADEAGDDAEAAEVAPALQTALVADRTELEALLVSNDPAGGALTPNQLDAFDPSVAATIFACTEQLTPQLNGAIDGVARAVITDTSGYLGVPADTEVLIIIAGDSYVVADEASCEVFATEALFS